MPIKRLLLATGAPDQKTEITTLLDSMGFICDVVTTRPEVVNEARVKDYALVLLELPFDESVAAVARMRAEGNEVPAVVFCPNPGAEEKLRSHEAAVSELSSAALDQTELERVTSKWIHKSIWLD
jgi:DNA-binding response OmpR family regulator